MAETLRHWQAPPTRICPHRSRSQHNGRIVPYCVLRVKSGSKSPRWGRAYSHGFLRAKASDFYVLTRSWPRVWEQAAVYQVRAFAPGKRDINLTVKGSWLARRAIW